ncbi:MAG: hypothetical protein Q9162_005451 [Coniocarpon cinnabarinum]
MASAKCRGFGALQNQLHVRRLEILGARRYLHSGSPRDQQSTKPTFNGNTRTTDFGFETVSESLKASRVGEVFSSVATSYDSMNDFMSLGVHRLWKDYFVRDLDPGLTTQSHDASKRQGWNILDIAGGTGDIAFRMLNHAEKIHGDKSTHVTVADINSNMLDEGKKRSKDTAYAASGQLDFVEANAEDLKDFDSNSMDLYTVAFGIRNFTDKPAALREAFRVLKPGGLFACLEFSKVDSALFNAVYKRWSFGAIPLIGQLVAGDRQSYQYLVESIERFPSQERFCNMIQDAGFIAPSPAYQNLTGGIAAIHKGIKPIR